jgi:hypothetical protein
MDSVIDLVAQRLLPPCVGTVLPLSRFCPFREDVLTIREEEVGESEMQDMATIRSHASNDKSSVALAYRLICRLRDAADYLTI